MADSVVLTQAAPPPVAKRDDATSSTNMTLHPLVVINVADHFTRARAQSGGQPGTRVFGALLGEQVGRHVEIANSFEVKTSLTGASAVLPPSPPGPAAHRNLTWRPSSRAPPSQR